MAVQANVVDPTSRLASALQEAVAILHLYFPDAYNLLLTCGSPDQRLEKPTNPTAAPLIAGAETLTAALLVRLLSSALHDRIIHTMSVGSSNEDMFKRGDQLIGKCGAIYYIDANGVDLEYHLRAASKGYTGVEGFETIIDMTGFMRDKPDLQGLLAQGGLYVDWTAEKERRDLSATDDSLQLFEKIVSDLPQDVLEYGS